MVQRPRSGGGGRERRGFRLSAARGLRPGKPRISSSTLPQPGVCVRLGAAALREKGQPLPWRSSGCTRRLVTVSHRAKISSLSSRSSRLRQPSISSQLSPDISTPFERRTPTPSPLQAHQAGALATNTGSTFPVRRQRASGIPDPWAEVIAVEVSQET